MADLDEISKRLGDAFKNKARNQWIASLTAKLLFAVFSAISGISQFTGSEKLVLSNYVGIGSAIFAFLGAMFIAIFDKDSSQELEIAREAIVSAREEQQKFRDLMYDYADLRQYDVEQVRARELYQAVFIMRGVLEGLIHNDYIDLDRSVPLILETAKRSLTISLGYQTAEHYTLCVYRARDNAITKQRELKCIAQARTIDCGIDDARVWPTGVGVAGAALARGTEVVVPDMGALQIGSLYADTAKPDDADRYRSIAAVPILASGHNNAWGVVVGTSDRADHFAVGPDHPGVQTVEAVRALAGMVGLAVRVDQLRVSCGHTPLPAGVTDKLGV